MTTLEYFQKLNEVLEEILESLQKLNEVLEEIAHNAREAVDWLDALLSHEISRQAPEETK